MKAEEKTDGSPSAGLCIVTELRTRTRVATFTRTQGMHGVTLISVWYNSKPKLA